MYSGFFNKTIRELKHRLNRIGELGSPCNTPLSTLTGAVQSLLTAIGIYDSLYTLLNN